MLARDAEIAEPDRYALAASDQREILSWKTSPLAGSLKTAGMQGDPFERKADGQHLPPSAGGHYAACDCGRSRDSFVASIAGRWPFS